MALLKHDYLDERMLKGLAAYKYKAGGYTWLDEVHNPMWNWIVENLFPMWLAPNLVTLVGLIFILGSHALLWVYAPAMNGEDAPRWVHLAAGLGVIIYVNLDCMDGKQARRTGTSSPLGQLFDHGCDALTTGIILVNAGASANLQISPPMISMMFCAMITWILAQWEEYHTGIMVYGNALVGVLEANYGLGGIPIISAIFGPSVWAYHLSTVLPFELPKILANLTVLDALFGIACIGMVTQVFGQIWRAFHHTSTDDEEDSGRKTMGGTAALQHLLYIVIFFALAYAFLLQPAYGGASHTRALLTYVNVAYATIATQLIMAHMAKEVWRPAITPYLGLLIGALNYKLDFLNEAAVYGMALIVVVSYVHYVVNICRQVCDYLGIACLTIKQKSG